MGRIRVKELGLMLPTNTVVSFKLLKKLHLACTHEFGPHDKANSTKSKT